MSLSFWKGNGKVALATIGLIAFWGVDAQEKTPYDYVDPLIGTIKGGERRW